MEKEIIKRNIQSEIVDKLTPEIIEDMKKIWFTSDLHHAHNKIIDICKRPCKVEDHTQWLIDSINTYVKKKDILYLLGDVSFAKKPEAEVFLNKLNGEKFLIVGNHDKSLEHAPQFTQIKQIKDFTYGRYGLNIHIVLMHYPCISWNRKIYGSWHLYGHVHGRYVNKGLSFDVGIDNNDLTHSVNCYHKPINLYEVVMLMNEKQKNGDDNFNEIE